MKITDDMLYRSAPKAEKLWLDLLPSDDKLPEHQFSKGFERKMKKLIRTQRRFPGKSQPAWKVIAQKAAIILLIISLGFGTVMVSSPTARAAFVKWVTELYEIYVVYRYAGETAPKDMPRYEITEVPDGFVETDRTELSRMVEVTYTDGTGDVIYFSYRYMAQGGAVFYGTEDITVLNIKVNHLDGKFFESKIPGKFNTITWIDEQNNIQFDIVGTQSYSDMLHMAESVSLEETTK